MGLRFTVYSLGFTKNKFYLFGVICILSFFYHPNKLSAQVNTTSFGFVLKPIFPSKYLRTGPETRYAPDSLGNMVSFRLAQSSGFNFGGIVRRGITKNLSFETGITYIKRNYQLDIEDSVLNFSGSSSFKIIGYEIPIQALVFVQLSREIWMNASLGTSLDIFPSDVETRGTYYITESMRLSNLTVFNAGLLANIGWEYRTEKSGTIYIGSSYHRSFKDTYRTVVGYYRKDIKAPYPDAVTDFRQTGDYLTLDFRYYFQGDVTKKKTKKK